MVFIDSIYSVIDTFIWSIDSQGTTIWESIVIGSSTPPIFPQLCADSSYFNYMVNLTVSNCCATSSYTNNLIVRPAPIVGFTTSPIVPPSGVVTGTSIDFYFDPYVVGGDLITDYMIIDYGDGSPPDIINNPSMPLPLWDIQTHQYFYNGATDTCYEVTLTGVNECDTTKYIDTICVFASQVYSKFTCINSTQCEGDISNPIIFVDQSIGSSANSTITWCFDWDPVTNTCGPSGYTVSGIGDTVTHTYADCDTNYIVMHTIFDNTDPISPSVDTSYNDDWSCDINVFCNPTAVIDSCWNICKDDTIEFINSSFTNNNFNFVPNPFIPNSNIRWYVDGILQIPTGGNLIYIASTVGTHTLSLSVTDNYGCSDSTSCQFEVYELPSASFTSNDTCQGDPTSFINTSTNPITGQSWSNYWEFRDPIGPTSTLENPTYTFSNSSTLFQVYLEITTPFGCKDDTVISIYTNNNPTAIIDSVLPVCEDDTTLFSNSSLDGSAYC